MTPVLGAILTLLTVGAELFNVTTYGLLVTVAPSLSVALATQVILSVVEMKLASSCHVAPVFVAPFEADQAYETLNAPSFASVAVALHVSELDVVKLLFGEIKAAVIVGAVFKT